MAFDLTALSAYTQENTDLIAEAILKTDVLSNIAVRTGVSAGTTTLNIFSADFADAARACGWAASGDFVYDQIPVTVEDRQIKQEVCPTDLREYWLSERMQPGEAGNEEVPFAELVSSYFLSGISKNLEDFIGTQLLSQVTTGNGAQTYTGAAALTPSNALEQLNDLYDALDERAKMMDDVIIVMSPANYRIAVRAMVAANYFSYNFGDGQGEVMLPGTNAKLVKSSGFAGVDTIIALPSKYAVFATGLMSSDDSSFKMFYDQGVDTVKVTAYYRRGLGVYSVNQCATNGL